MENTEKPSAPESSSSAGGAKEKVEKQARQLAYDVRYKTKQAMSQKSGGQLDPAAVRKAYASQLGKSPAAPAVKARAKQMLLGEDIVDVNRIVAEGAANAMYKVFVEKKGCSDKKKDYKEEVESISEGDEKTYKIRVTDKKTGNSYVRMATRAKISELRANSNISSVEMTGYGEPTKSEKHKGSQTAAAKAGKDYDGDGKVESSRAEYKGSKDKAIKKALAKEDFTWKDAFGELIEKKSEDKKITGKGVDNSKLITVFPNEGEDVKEEAEAKAPAAEVDPQLKQKQKRVGLAKRQILLKKMQAVRAGAGEEITASNHLEGEDIADAYTVHTADKKANTPAWQGYKAGKKNVKTGEPLYKKGDDVKEDAEYGYDEEGKSLNPKDKKKESKKEEEDYRGMKTKVDLVRNKLRAMGLNMSQEPEGETIEEGEKLAQKAYKRAQELGAKRRKSKDPSGIYKSERAGYNLAQSQRSDNESPATQRGNQTGGGPKDYGFAKHKKNPVKSKSVGDTGRIGHAKKAQEKTSVGKSGKKLKTPKYKLSFQQRRDHHSDWSKRQELKDPKKNPKHTANTKKEDLDTAKDIVRTILEKDLNAKERRALPDKDFVFPGKGEGPKGKQAGSYPIPDEKHARSALAMSAAHASPEKQAEVKAAVKKKFPNIKIGD